MRGATMAPSDTMTPESAVDPLLASDRVCWLLDVSDRWLRRRLSAGQFPPPDAKLGRSMRWRRSTIERFIADARS